MSLTSNLYKIARFSANVRAGRRAVETGSPMPIIRRLFNILWGRGIISKLWWK